MRGFGIPPDQSAKKILATHHWVFQVFGDGEPLSDPQSGPADIVQTGTEQMEIRLRGSMEFELLKTGEFARVEVRAFDQDGTYMAWWRVWSSLADASTVTLREPGEIS